MAATPAKRDEASIDAQSVVSNLFKSIDKVRTLTYTMIYSERLDEEKIHTDSNRVKYQKYPLKVYVKSSDDTEVLWPVDEGNSDAYVHPHSFPYITLKLDPDGSIMRKDQHHGVESCGYAYFCDILKQSASKEANTFDSHFLYLGEVVYNGLKCYKLAVIQPEFKYVPYVVLKGETVISIARKLMLSEYMIVQHNNLSSYTDVSTGQTIMVPSTYAKSMTLCIDKATMLPALIRVEDEKGLFEQYVFKNVRLNPALSEMDFSKKNENYHF